MASSDAAGFGARFQLTFVTNDPDLAVAADAAGVDYVGVDVERLDKTARQTSEPGSRISPHLLEDLARLKPRLNAAKLFCRLDPPHPGQQAQIDEALALGAQVLMLPYFRRIEEAERFVNMVAGSARTMLLVETVEAAGEIDALAALDGVDEVMVGLNDLSIDCGRGASRFGLLSSRMVAGLAQAVRGAGKRFSIGGLGRWDDAGLKTPPDLIYAQYPRLGAEGAWLSRSFERGLTPSDWPAAVRSLRDRLDHWAAQDAPALEAARQALADSARPA